MSSAVTPRIAFGFDEPYLPHAAALLASLRRYASSPLQVLVIHDGVERSLQQRLEEVAPNSDFLWREVGDADVPQMGKKQHFTRAILYRLGLEALAPPDWTRVLYLDVDMIACADIVPLWRTDLAGQALGAVADCWTDPEAFAVRWGLSGDPAYFNSGLMLIDLEQVRKDRLFSKAIEFAVPNLEDPRFTDQDALNYSCWGRWRRIDARWNVQRHMTIRALIDETPPDRRLNGAQPAIVHFTGPEKPWVRQGYHPWSWLYWDSLRRTSFWREVSDQGGVGLLAQARLWQRYQRARWRRG